MNNARRHIALFIAIMLGCLCIQPSVQAHVLLSDSSGTTGAILHVTPDDDPVAGEPSSLFFDIQGQALEPRAVLRITGQAIPPTTVPVTVTGNTVSATYVFEERGAYTISLTVTEAGSGRTISLSHAQRVSRGTTGSPLDNPSHAWAEALLIASLCGVATLIILAVNNRRYIISLSK